LPFSTMRTLVIGISPASEIVQPRLSAGPGAP
jgi:hypothetical protein